MKFGKSLKLTQQLKWNQKWADSYVDYKQLKQLVQILSSIHPSASPEEATEALLKEAARLPAGKELHDHLLMATAQAQAPAAAVTDEGLAIGGVVGSSGDVSTGGSSSAPSSTGSGKPKIQRRMSIIHVPVSDFKQKAFIELLRRELAKVDNLCSEELRAMADRISDLKAPKSGKEIVDASESNRLIARQELLSIMRSKERIEAFFQMNFLAFEKILKKFDKKITNIAIEDLKSKTADKDLKDTEEYDEPSTPVASAPVSALAVSSKDALTPVVMPFVDRIKNKHLSQLEEITCQIDELFVSVGKPSKMEEEEHASKMEKAEGENLLVVDSYPTYTELILNQFAPETLNKFRLMLAYNGMGRPITVPVIVVKGKFAGPVFGITAALHGNELNGIPLIHRLIREIALETFSGTLIAIPVLNPPGFLRHQRDYFDGHDLNRLFPGKPNGNCAQIYCYHIMEKIIKHFDYLIDLHTASFGRINSLYVRADMNNRTTHHMALLQNPQIIVHNTAPDGSLRAAAMKLGIPSITVEIGDPSRIHKRFVKSAFLGVENIMSWLQMVDLDIEAAEKSPTVCSKSFWMFSKHGGLLNVIPDINTWVEKDQVIARVRNMFGDIVATYFAPTDGIVVGKNVDPVCASGDRILHLGVLGDSFPDVVHDGH